MREIKFRAWNTVINEMVFCGDGDFWAVMDEWVAWDNPPESPINEGVSFEIMQYTGLKIRKDELYDGDIIQFDWLYQDDSSYTSDSENMIGVIEWRDRWVVSFAGGAMSFDLHEVNQATFERFWREDYNSGKSEYFKMTCFRLLGNIHQHPELLEQNQ